MSFSPWYSGHYALLIGVQHYSQQDEAVLPKVSAPENNVECLARELTRIGFECKSLFSPSLDEYLQAKDELLRHHKPNDRLLIYYSGHAHQPEQTDRSLVFLTFRDTKFYEDKTLIYSSAVKIDVFCDVHEFKSKHILFILDCCYAGAGTLRSPSIATDDTEVWLKYRCRCVIAACTEEQLANDVYPGSKYTVFTEAIAADIHDAYKGQRILTASELANKVRDTVKRTYRGDQIPVYRILPGSDTAGEYLMTLPPDEEIISRLKQLLDQKPDEFQLNISLLSAQEKENLLRILEIAIPKKAPTTHTFHLNSTAIEFILIPKGGFIFGSLTEDWSLDERVRTFFKEVELPSVDKFAQMNEVPLSLEYLEDFWIMTTPVTEELILLYYLETQSNLPSYWHNQPELPVVGYTVKEALEFANWLQTKLDISQISTGRLTLPSEKEWEKAARGIKTTVYPWGNLPNECANVKGIGPGKLTPVIGTPDNNWAQTNHWPREQENPFGLIDMIGNVWEMCRTNWSDNHLSNPGHLPAIKGGSFDNNIHDCRIATRRAMTRPLGNIGFRLVISSED